MFRNVYQAEQYAHSYSALDWSGTYFLVYRDLPDIPTQHGGGLRALDFGCGTGRSSRLLRGYGYDVTGVGMMPDSNMHPCLLWVNSTPT